MPMVKRNRHQGIPIPSPRMAVKRLRQPRDQPPSLIIFIPVLEPDDGIEHLPFGPVTGPGPLEMPMAIHTMGTEKIGFNRLQARKRIAALSAKRLLDRHRLRRLRIRPRKSQIQGALAPVAGSFEGGG